MSTKCSMYWDGNLHIYQECFDENHIYIEREEKELHIKIELDLKQTISLARCFDYESLKKQASLTDEKIDEHVRAVVKARLNSNAPISRISGSLVYGFADDPEDLQIEKASNHYKTRRNDLKKILDELESGRRYWEFNFGLEELI